MIKIMYDSQLNNKLNNFVNTPVNYENPFFNNEGSFKSRQLLKINEIFFTYFLELRFPSDFCKIFIIIIVLSFLIFGLFYKIREIGDILLFL